MGATKKIVPARPRARTFDPPRVTAERVAAGVQVQLSSQESTDLIGCLLAGKEQAEADRERFLAQGDAARAEQADGRVQRITGLLARLTQEFVAQYRGTAP